MANKKDLNSPLFWDIESEDTADENDTELAKSTITAHRPQGAKEEAPLSERAEEEAANAARLMSVANARMLKSQVSATWQRDDLPSLMTMALDVVESLYGMAARELAEADLAQLETELNQHLLAAKEDTEQAHLTGQQLLTALYGPLGFVGDWERFFAVDNCLMDRILSRRRGIPVSMAVLLLHLCDHFGVRAEGISFPGHFLVRVFTQSNPAQHSPTSMSHDTGTHIDLEDAAPCYIIDPFSGQSLSHHQIEQLLRGARGNLAKLTPRHLLAAEPLDIILRLLDVTKASFIHHQHFTHALMCSQLLLTLRPNCPLERRDRGFLYEQLECHQLAAEDFEYFIEQCPEDPLADVLKIQAMALDLLPHVLH